MAGRVTGRNTKSGVAWHFKTKEDKRAEIRKITAVKRREDRIILREGPRA